MPLTPTYSLPYPAPTDPADVPTDMQKLATAIEAIPPLGFWSLYQAGRIMTSNMTRVTSQASFALQTDGGLFVDAAGTGEHIYFGSAADASLYRSSAGLLATDGALATFGAAGAVTAYGIAANASAQWLWRVRKDGAIYWGDGTNAADVSLSRFAANVLGVDRSLWVGVGNPPGNASLTAAAAGDGWPRVGLYTNSYMWFGPGTAGVDTNLYRAAAGVLKTDSAIATGSYGTTLPTAPVDGQEFTLVDSVSAPKFAWRFRYNASSSSSYKWEFVGGAPVNVIVMATEGKLEQLPLGDLATVGPAFTVPRAGQYEVSWGCRISYAGASGAGYMDMQAGANNPAGSGLGIVAQAPVNMYVYGSQVYAYTGIGAGEQVIAKYSTGSQGGGGFYTYFGLRWLRVIPVRVQ